jgi:phosphopantothenoylcysteine decarboxylase/phosphopantothenate--cysteine ligase
VTLTGRRVVLGVSGGIACYKSCIVARRLTELGAAVDVVLTRAATEFVRPVTFEALTRRPVLTSLWEPDRALSHIDLARGAELIALVPATAHLLARAAQGIADDLLAAMLLATDVPILAAPGMNDHMWAHPATRANLDILSARGWTFVGPVTGPLAEGPSDRPGRMAEPEEILVRIERALRSGSRLSGKQVVVTAGPTREPIDAVRVVTNPSSGRMGYALAARAFARGAEVILVSGPTSLEPPVGVSVVPVVSTDDLVGAMEKALPDADVVIMAAAPADYRPATVASGKPARKSGPITLSLTPTPDVLVATIGRRKARAVIVGFALETGPHAEARAREKLAGKQLDLVVLNRADEAGSGFESPTNHVVILSRDAADALEALPKSVVADRILDRVESLL